MLGFFLWRKSPIVWTSEKASKRYTIPKSFFFFLRRLTVCIGKCAIQKMSSKCNKPYYTPARLNVSPVYIYTVIRRWSMSESNKWSLDYWNVHCSGLSQRKSGRTQIVRGYFAARNSSSKRSGGGSHRKQPTQQGEASNENNRTANSNRPSRRRQR